MILDVDLGNTRLKWRLAGQADALPGYLEPNSDSLILLARQLPPVSRVRLASVASEARTNEVVGWLFSAFGVYAEIARVIDRLNGFRTAYASPCRLGVDRWLAALAAYQMFREACVVVDAGTALTVEVIGADGLHHGGYIVPGLQLMARSLGDGTDAVQVVLQADAAATAPGTSTEEAVSRGVLGMVLGLVERSRTWLSRDMANPSHRLILTGGDAERLAPHFPDAHVRPGLVLDGLAYTNP